MSRLDVVYRSLLISRFFTKGWGKPDDLRRLFEFRKQLSDRKTCNEMVSKDYPIIIDKRLISALRQTLRRNIKGDTKVCLSMDIAKVFVPQRHWFIASLVGEHRWIEKLDRNQFSKNIARQLESQKEVKIIEGHFKSPFVDQLPGLMPPEVETARFQMILPVRWESKWGSQLKPVCVHLAGTGDHGFYRRRQWLARPLVKQAGIASIILENPFYGSRKPKKQVRSMLHNVSDLFVMGGALVLESLALFHWCERQGYGPLGITGLSMGGHMASLAASSWMQPVSLVPCLSWSTASSVFTQGVLSSAINWQLLQKQYDSDRVYWDELIKLVCSPEQNYKNHAFEVGLDFPKNYPVSVNDLEVCEQRVVADQYSNHDPSAGSTTKTAQQKNDHSSTNAPFRSLKNPSMQFHTSTSVFESHSNQDSVNNSNKSSQFTFKSITNSLNRLKLSDRSQLKQTPKEVVDFMRGVMDDFTHLGNFTVPVDPSLIIIVVALEDAYIPRDSVLSLQDLWPGSQVRYVDSGHIVTILTKQAHFRNAIIDAFDAQIQKYHTSENSNKTEDDL